MTRRIDKKQGNVRGFPAYLILLNCGLIISSPLMKLLSLQYHKQIIPPHRLTDLQTIQNIKMEEFTYEQIRAKALKQGVKDNKVHIGLWASLNNYLKTRRKKNGKVSTYYISLQKLAY